MRQRLYHRLQQLEVESARLRSVRESRDREADGEEAIKKVEPFLRLRGIEQTPMESLFDALARALEIGNRELRAQLMEGIDPIHKWLMENGVFEEIERRKAAGTWPAAEGRGGCKV